MIKGKLDKKASTATGYAWFVWNFHENNNSQLVWIPPTRKKLEKKLKNSKTLELSENSLRVLEFFGSRSSRPR